MTGAEHRLSATNEHELTDEQRPLWNAITGGRRSDGRDGGMLDADGGLLGPFNAWLRSPAVGLGAAELGERLRFDNSLEPRLLELVVCTVGAHWRSNFEFWAHSRLGERAGLDPAVLTALAEGREPELTATDEKVVYAVVRELLDDRRVSDATYAAAVDLLGEGGIVDLLGLAGYYTVVSFTLNTFRVPLPPGEDLIWPA